LNSTDPSSDPDENNFHFLFAIRKSDRFAANGAFHEAFFGWLGREKQA
jgi:hypothetical protein